MSSDNDFFVRPRRKSAMGKDNFGKALRKLIDSDLVAGPWKVFASQVDNDLLSSPSGLVDFEGDVVQHGEDTADIDVASILKQYGKQDITVLFNGFNMLNDKVNEDMAAYNYQDVLIAFAALKTAQKVEVMAILNSDDEEEDDDRFEDDEESADEEDETEEIKLQDVLIFSGKGGPLYDELDESSVLRQLLSDIFDEYTMGENAL